MGGGIVLTLAGRKPSSVILCWRKRDPLLAHYNMFVLYRRECYNDYVWI